MRLGFGGRRWHRPHHHAGIGLLVIGAIIVLLVLPLYFWAVFIGIFLAFLGWQLLNQR